MKLLKNILCAAKIALCTTLNSLHGAQLNPDDKVILQGCDSDKNDTKIEIEIKYAQCSKTLKYLLKDLGAENPIPIQNITKRMLTTYIIPALKAIKNSDNSNRKTLALLALKDTLASISLEELAELMININFLDIDPLLTMTIDIFATKTRHEQLKNLITIFKNLEKNKLKLPKPIQKLIVDKISNYKDYYQDKTLTGHTHSVESLCISPDSKMLFSASYDKTIKIWDIESGECRKTLIGHTDLVKSLCISPDGKTLFSASYDKTIKIWDIESGECRKTLIGHTDLVQSLCISPDGKTLFSASWDYTIKIWDIESGECHKTLNENINSVDISPDGKTLFLASYDTRIKMWDTEKDRRIKTINGHTHSVVSLCISPDGKTLFLASYDKTIKIWDLAQGTCIKTLIGHTDSVESLCISPDGKTLFSASHDKTIKIWDLAQGTCIKTLNGHADWVKSVCISPDGKRLFSASHDKTIKTWKIPPLNRSYKSEETNLIMQAWLITELTKDQENSYNIEKSSYEEKIWNEFPKETRVYLKKKLRMDTQKRLDNEHAFTIQQNALEHDENEKHKLEEKNKNCCVIL